MLLVAGLVPHQPTPLQDKKAPTFTLVAIQNFQNKYFKKCSCCVGIPFRFDVACFIDADCIAIRCVLADGAQHQVFLLRTVAGDLGRIE